tara:strand:- start:220 stop:1542 length:1323 start_codon:yes stop_codon:yes gene_type:complete
MTNFQGEFEFFQGPKLTYDFKGGDMSSEGGILLVKELDEKLRFTEGIAEAIVDKRDTSQIDHTMTDLVRERMYMLIQGHEDTNDADRLRSDLVFKSVVNRGKNDLDLGSQSTLCRLENSVDRRDIKRLMDYSIEHWLSSFEQTPSEITLDVDPTDDPAHGHQQMALFHGYYGQVMYCPLIISANGINIMAVLRPGSRHGASKIISILKYLIKRIRARFPDVSLQFRADAAFGSGKVLDYLDSVPNLTYAVGLIANSRLKAANTSLLKKAVDDYTQTDQKQRLFQHFKYQAKPWSKSRHVIAKAEAFSGTTNQRFIVTNFENPSADIYDNFYVYRAQDSENEIKELKLGFYADRLSCHRFIANQFRLLLSLFAYQLVRHFKQKLHGSCLENASIQTLRCRLFKVAVRIKQSVRRLWFNFCSAFPLQELFLSTHQKILLLKS